MAAKVAEDRHRVDAGSPPFWMDDDDLPPSAHGDDLTFAALDPLNTLADIADNLEAGVILQDASPTWDED